MILLLPFPDPALAPNRAAGRHWTATRALKDAARDHARLIAKKALKEAVFAPQGHSVPLRLTFHPPDNRRRDLDALLSASKHAIDGIAQALGFDDSRFEPVVLARGSVWREGGIVVEVGAWAGA